VKIGLFFGSFNPIHVGHLIIANTVVEDTDVERVWFVVSPLNPFKSSKSLLHEFDRIDMVRMAIEDNFNFEATDVEFHMPKPSYTADTLAYLTDRYPQHDFKLIIGEDNLHHFPKWKNHEVILEHYGMYVYPRPNAKPSALREHPNVKLVEAPMVDISATFIRRRIKNDKTIRYLVHHKVAEYIAIRKFYI
jgi:nicotinate-nucleotide adenylyltransferase